MTPEELADLALTFYRDTLGLELRNDVAREDFRWITVGAASQPGVAIVLTNYLNGSPANGDAVAALVAKGALNGVHFKTDDLDATFARVRDAGAEIVQEPTDQPWAHAISPCATRPATSRASISRPSPGQRRDRESRRPTGRDQGTRPGSQRARPAGVPVIVASYQQQRRAALEKGTHGHADHGHCLFAQRRGHRFQL